MKKAFSLVELLVVIAIIAILAGVILGTFSGGSESARAARCLSNMRNLAAACQSYGLESSHYPHAGSFEWVDVYLDRGNKAEREYGECKGWISWNSRNAYRKDDRGRGPSSHQASASWNVSSYEANEDTRKFALTNGVLWKYVSGDHGVYVCPEHQKTMRQRNNRQPAWSYVMNAYFRWDYTKGARAMPVDDDSIHRWFGKLNRADRRLLFAEMPFSGVGAELVVEESGERCDCVLQYKGSIKCDSPEVIGFNHKIGKRDIYAHVCFADGHAEKLAWPKGGMSDEELKELTRWLCEGIDISFDGKKYKNLTKDEKSN